jgi:hypothetical protein
MNKDIALVRQARELSCTSPFSYASIRRLQKGLMSPLWENPGEPLTESETLQAVPVAIKMKIANPAAPVGIAIRKAKGLGRAPSEE